MDIFSLDKIIIKNTVKFYQVITQISIKLILFTLTYHLLQGFTCHRLFPTFLNPYLLAFLKLSLIYSVQINLVVCNFLVLGCFSFRQSILYLKSHQIFLMYSS